MNIFTHHHLLTLDHFPLRNKTILLRVDFNVPLEQGKVKDNSRIKASLPTIEYLLRQDCKIIMATHLGQPGGKIVPELKVNPLAEELKHLLKASQLKAKVFKLNNCLGRDIKQAIQSARPRQIFLLENLRFYPEEEENDPLFAHSLASLADVYINDAFSASHRLHASIEAITHFLPSLAGFLLEKEISHLSKAINPLRPAVWILGGGKLDKIGLIYQALKKADYILVGGALAFPFLQAKGVSVGMSKIDSSSVSLARRILKKAGKNNKIILPRDFVVAEKFSSAARAEIVPYNQIKNNQMALDLGPETIKLFKIYLRKARTIVWNGPLGYYEWAKFAAATKEIGRFLGHLTAISLGGGGETADAIRKFHLEHNFTHLSTGGGATIAFLSGKKLPGIEALEKNCRKFGRKN